MARFWLVCWVLVAASVTLVGCGESNGSGAAPIEGFVCGKDGRTYSVEEAAQGEQDVEHRGRCDEPMHCVSPNDCFVGDVCVPESQWCIPGPTHCNCPGVFEPVCGGDGRNYINACEAACAGVGIRHDGYCEEPPGEGCVRAGCSGQLCVEEGMDIASTCEWRPVYECYQQATCERQQNGQCGFTPTYELVECLERFGEGMCRIDPRWQDGFQAECESPQVPGITGIVEVHPRTMLRLGEWFAASFQLLEPPVFGDLYEGEGMLSCDGERTMLEGLIMMTPIGDLEVTCTVLPETNPGECYDDGDCPPGHYCQHLAGWPADGMDPSIPDPVPPGVCVDLCAVIDCAPGYVCEAGQCLPGCPVDTHIPNFEGQCVPKCYGPEQCGDEQHCNAPEVCRQDPACPECDVCVGWCEPPAGDCRTNGCQAGWTCDYCQTPDGGAEWICLPPNAGACLPPDECRPTGCNGEICASQDVASPCVALPEFACYREVGICELQPWGQCGWTPTPELDECLSQFDCRAKGCGDGLYCGFCWTSWECIPEGAVC
ncbi:MAG: hypothetical protein WBM46_09085 [Polyangiales bacterium]|jgi:hypothetical protein